MRVTDFKSIKLKIASPEEILSWSHGEVTKPETINYRTQRPEKDGLFCERIFGPTKDWECYCGKYRRIRYKGVVCDRCGVEVTRSIVRRERMGHIQLAVPVAHIWFLRSLPSKIGAILDVPMSQVEMVAYFSGYMITTVNEELKEAMRRDIEQEFKSKIKSAKEKTKIANKEKKGKVEKVEKEEGAAPTMESRLRSARTEAVRELDGLRLGRVLSEVEFRNLSLKYGAVFEAATGAEAIQRVMESLDLKALDAQIEKEVENAGILQKKKSLVRLKIVKNLSQNGIRPEWMLISQLPILPSDLRPMVQLEGGRFASSDLNDLYRRVINRNNRLKKLLELKAPEVICRNEKRMLQEAVDALIDNSARRGLGVMSSSQKRPLKSLADMLKGKQGRFRQNLLGKRVDYSARSVIVAGPELRLDECGIPKNMALELFKPFVIREIIKRELSHNVRAANRLIEDGVDEVWAILEEVIKDKLVLLNRAPTLHRLGVQAFKPVLIEGLAIRIHPMVCRAFNADFDGDQMAVHLPLSDEAQKEAGDLMLSSRNLLKPANGQPIVRPTQDIVLGAYFLTHIIPGSLGEGKTFSSKNEAVLAWENSIVAINASIKVYMPLEKRLVPEEKFLETSVGRIIFNQALPNDFTFVNEAMGSSKLTDLVDRLIEIYGAERVGIMLDILKKLGFEYATRSGITWSMNEIEVPKGKDTILDVARREVEKLEEYFERGLITEEERYKKVVETWSHAISKVHKLIPASLPEGSSVAPIINSKARGSWTQLNQMAGMKGLVSNPAGNIIEFPVLHSYKEGLNVLEYFISTHGARKGTADTALKTATAGYLTRRLVDVAQDVVIKEKDCGDTMGIELVRSDAEKHNQSFFNKIYGRFLIEDIVVKDGRKEIVLAKAGEAIDKKVAEAIELHKIDRVLVRSVLRCKTDHGLCQKCYGYDLGNNRIIGLGQAVGIVAAQAIGEPGTQLTMRTFHTGGVAGVSDITMGLPRVQELFEVQPPKGRATISEVDGIVLEVREEGKYRIVTMLEEVGSGEEPKKPEKKRRTSKVALSSTNEQGRREYKILKEMKVLVHEGSKVKKGEQLSEGHVDVKELFKFAGRESVERYIVTEVQKIYTIEGDPIHDKHIEVIVRQMFARVRIKEGGDSHFAMGEIVEKDIFKQVNRDLKRKGKNPARAVQLLMGITKVSHTTDSFLSSASFQETVKVLVNAAVSGKEDKLRGLKENVIIGRLIPAGTGYRGMDTEK